MPFKISGLTTSSNANSEDIFINTIKFTDPNQSKSNVDVKKLVYKSSSTAAGVEKWVKSFTVTPLSDTSYIDASTIKATVTNNNSSTGLSNRDVISGNEQNYSDAEKSHVYYGDYMSFSASPLKGYTNPTISTALTSTGITDNISLADYISSSGTMVDVTAPSVKSCDTYNTDTAQPVTAIFKNNSSYPVIIYYGLGLPPVGNNSGTASEWNETNEVAAGSEISVSISPGIKGYTIYLYAAYGVATSSTASYNIKTYTPPKVWISVSATSCYLGETITLTGNESGYNLDSYDSNQTKWRYTWEASSNTYFSLSAPYDSYDHHVVATANSTIAGEAVITVRLQKSVNRKYSEHAIIDGEGAADYSGSEWSNWSTVASDTRVISCKKNTSGDTGVGGSTTCVDENTAIMIDLEGHTKAAKDILPYDKIVGCDENGNLIETKVLNLFLSDHADYMYIVHIDGNYTITLSNSHPLLTKRGYCNVEGIFDYKKLEMSDEILTTSGYRKISYIEKIPNNKRVYNFYTECDNFVANGIVVACENLDIFKMVMAKRGLLEGGKPGFINVKA